MGYRHERLRAINRERYLDALDEAREKVRLACRDYYDALDAVDELDAQDEGGDSEDREMYRRRRRGPRREEAAPSGWQRSESEPISDQRVSHLGRVRVYASLCSVGLLESASAAGRRCGPLSGGAAAVRLRVVRSGFTRPCSAAVSDRRTPWWRGCGRGGKGGRAEPW